VRIDTTPVANLTPADRDAALLEGTINLCGYPWYDRMTHDWSDER